MFLQTSLFQTYFNQTYLRVLKSESSFLSIVWIADVPTSKSIFWLIAFLWPDRQVWCLSQHNRNYIGNRLTKNQIVQFQPRVHKYLFSFSGVCHHLASQKKLFDIRILHGICPFRVSFCTLFIMDFSAVWFMHSLAIFWKYSFVCKLACKGGAILFFLRCELTFVSLWFCTEGRLVWVGGSIYGAFRKFAKF